MFKRAVLVSAIASALLATAPVIANADPLTDLLCRSGSAQFCPAPMRPPPPPQQNTPPPQQNTPPPAPPQQGTYYRNCTEAWNAGVAPLRRNDPGYAPHLDRDNDGIACEQDPR